MGKDKTVRITEEKVLELLRERLSYFQEKTDFSDTLFNSIREYVVIATDFDGNIQVYNEGVIKYYGYTHEEIVGRKMNIEVLFPENGIKTEKLQHAIENAKTQGMCSFKEENVRKDGSRFPVQIVLALIKDKNGMMFGFTMVVRDLTESKRWEREMKNLNEALERRVVERTAQLDDMVEKLKAEICVRNQVEERLSQSYEKLRRTLEETAASLSSALEMRDAYTAGHQRRVAQLACAISGEMGFSAEQTHGIRIAGILHDIGKISIPSELLSKPSKLSKIEFELIKSHANAGYEILKDIEFPWPIAQMVLQHHEVMDGSGYPSGLSGDKILMEARILCVADVVEAMVSHRPYRAALGLGAAMEEITQKRGILYDPVVVDVCVRLFNEKGFRLE